jgi:porin
LITCSISAAFAQTDSLGEGSWTSFKQNLGAKGFNFSLNYTGDFYSQTGGIENGTAYIHFFDFSADLDINELTGFNAGTLTLRALGKSGGYPNEYAGTAQGISNIEAPDLFRLYEVKLEKTFFNGKLSLLGGIIDLNGEFDVKETSGMFINPSHGIGIDYSQSGAGGPSIYPYTALGFRMGLNLYDDFNIKLAVFDGVPGRRNYPDEAGVYIDEKEGALAALEADYSKGSFDETDEPFMRAGLGAWTYTSEFDCVYNPDHAGKKHRSWGAYVFSEGKLFNAGTSPLYGFVRIGAANPELNPYGYFAAGGLLLKGVFTNDMNDNLGFALALAGTGSRYRNYALLEGTNVCEYELNIETTYSLSLFEFLELQPDLQYVIHPADAGRNALAMGLRTKLNF